MPTKKPFVKAYLSEEERARIASQARKAGLSISKFVREVCLCQEVKSIVDQQAVLALIQSKADLGRLGGLLKQHLSNPGAGESRHEDLRQLLKRIEVGQREVLRDFRLVSASYLKGKKK